MLERGRWRLRGTLNPSVRVTIFQISAVFFTVEQQFIAAERVGRVPRTVDDEGDEARR